MITLYKSLACALTVFLYIVMLRGDLKQNFVTWLFWVLLDAIALFSTIQEGGNYLVLLLYVCGGSVITIAIFCKGHAKWTWVEFATIVLVAICLVVWYLYGSKASIVASTVAVCLSAIPMFYDFYKKPDSSVGWLYTGFTTVNILSTLAGKKWSMEERFYPVCCTALCALLALVSFQRLPCGRER